MYTNINTPMAVLEIAHHIHQQHKQFSTIPADVLIEALSISMRNNMLQFRETFWHQLTGTAMGTPPAPTYVNLFFEIHENRILPKFTSNILLHKQYIDDIFGIWTPSDDSMTTILFEKSLNLYLYIPPHSTHPPSVLTGLVIGICHQIETFCSVEANKFTHLQRFFKRLRARRYTSTTLTLLYHRVHLLALQNPEPPPPLDPDDLLK